MAIAKGKIPLTQNLIKFINDRGAIIFAYAVLNVQLKCSKCKGTKHLLIIVLLAEEYGWIGVR